jgi:hypothetical protein
LRLILRGSYSAGVARTDSNAERKRHPWGDLLGWLLMFAAIILLVVGGSGIRWADHFGALFKRIAGIDSSYPMRPWSMNPKLPLP